MIWKASITIRDDKGQTSIHSFFLEFIDLETITTENQNPIAYVQEYAQNLNALITGQIISINLSLRVDLPSGLRAAPMPESDVEEGVTITYIAADADGQYPVRHRIPTANESFLSGGFLEYTGGDAVDNFLFMITNPSEHVANFTFGPCNNRGVGIGAVDRAIESFKRSRK